MLIDDARFLEFEPEIIAFASALADTGEYGDAAVLHGEIVDELLDDDGFADACAAEETNFAAAEIGFEKIDDLDAGLEHFKASRLFFVGGGFAMDGHVRVRDDGTTLIYGFAQDVEHAAESCAADGDGDGNAQAFRFHATDQAFGGLHGDGAHAAFADVLSGFADDVDGIGNVVAFAGDADGGVDFGDIAFGELNVHSGAGDLHNFTDYDLNGCFCRCHMLMQRRNCAGFHVAARRRDVARSFPRTTTLKLP